MTRIPDNFTVSDEARKAAQAIEDYLAKYSGCCEPMETAAHGDGGLTLRLRGADKERMLVLMIDTAGRTAEFSISGKTTRAVTFGQSLISCLFGAQQT
jgi:hypothetical protein